MQQQKKEKPIAPPFPAAHSAFFFGTKADKASALLCQEHLDVRLTWKDRRIAANFMEAVTQTRNTPPDARRSRHPCALHHTKAIARVCVWRVYATDPTAHTKVKGESDP